VQGRERRERGRELLPSCVANDFAIFYNRSMQLCEDTGICVLYDNAAAVVQDVDFDPGFVYCSL